MKKKFLALALTLAMVLGMTVPSAFAYYDDDPYEGWGDLIDDDPYEGWGDLIDDDPYEGWGDIIDDDDDESGWDTWGGDYLSSVSISPSTLTLDQNDVDTLEADISGTCDATDVYFTWSTNNSSVVSLSSETSGYCMDSVDISASAKNAGSATITCKATYGSTTKTATCYVTVVGGKSGYITNVTIDPDATLYLNGGGSSTYPLYADVDTSGTVYSSDIGYTWKSTDPSVARVSGSGSSATVTAVGNGNCSVYCTATYNGNSETSNYCSITVKGSSSTLYGISFRQSSISLSAGKTETIYVTPSMNTDVDGGDISFSWSSSDTGVASVSSPDNYSSYATVYGNRAGSAVITCKATYNGTTKAATCSVTVRNDGGSFYISRDLTSSYSTTYGTSNTINFNLVNTTSYNESYQWYVDGYKSSAGSGNTFNTKNLSVGTHKVYCNVYASRGGYDVTTNTCTVTVTDSGSLYISSNLQSSYTTTYGASYNISFTAKNTTSYGENYQWYVDGVKDNSSTGNTFNTRNLSVGTHKIYCYVYTSKGSYNTSTTNATVFVNPASSAPSSTASMNNFKTQRTYNNLFGDVYAANWFYSYVKTSYEYGLVNGKTQNTYCPFDNFTVAEALKIAACVHSTYYNGYSYTQNNLVNLASGATWYNVYADYCISNQIINIGDFSSYSVNCTRAQMAYIFSRCLPASELVAVRNVNIPDCNNTSTQYYSNIQTLYNAGIVSGNEVHFYNPTQYIKRSEVAKIVCTLTTPSTRDRSTF